MNENKKTISENNRFHVARHEIGDISRTRNVDVGVAASMWAHETEQTKFAAEYTEFIHYVTYLERESTPGNNLVKKYFRG